MTRLCAVCLLIILLMGPISAGAQSDPPPFRLTQQIGRGIPNHVEWQPGGDVLLVSTITGAWLYTDRLEDIAHIEEAHWASFSPDGRLLAGVNSDDRITLWDASTFHQVAVLGPHTTRVTELVWSPEGERIASLDQAGHIAIWQVDSPTPQVRIQLPDAAQIAWSREGTYLAAMADSGEVRVWATTYGQEVFFLPGFRVSDNYMQLLWRNDQQLLRWEWNEKYYGELWDVVTSRMVFAPTAGGVIGHPAYSPDGSLLAWGTMIRDGLTNESVMSVPGYQSTWTKDGSTIASSTYSFDLNATIDVTVSSVPGGEIQQVLHEVTDSVGYLRWNDDGDRLAGLGDGLKVWRVSTGETLGATYAHSGLEWPLGYSSDGSLLAATNDRAVQVWDTRTGELLANLTGHPQYVRFVLWQPHGTLLATSTQGRWGTNGSIDNMIRLWDLQPFSKISQPIYTYSHDSGIESIAWNPDGTRLASVDIDGMVRVWNATTHTVIMEFNARDDVFASPLGLDWSYQGALLRIWFFGSGNAGGVALWNAQTGEFLDHVGGNAGMIYSWTSDDELLSTRIWNWADIGYPQPIYEISIDIRDPRKVSEDGHSLILERLPATVSEAAFHPTGEAFAVVDDDGTLWVWDIPSGNRRFRLPDITSFLWSPDGSQLVIWSEKHPTQVISASDGTLQDELNACYTRNLVWSPTGNQIACSVEGALFLWER